MSALPLNAPDARDGVATTMGVGASVATVQISSDVRAYAGALGVEGVAIEQLTRADVVRHELVGRIIDAYDKDAKGASRK